MADPVLNSRKKMVKLAGFLEGVMVLVNIIISSEKKLILQYAENSWKVRI